MTDNEFTKKYVRDHILPLQKGLKPGAQKYFWESSGFGLKLTPTKLVFIVQRRIKGSGTEKRIVIGEYGVMSIGEARDKALGMRNDMRNGADPVVKEKIDVTRKRTLQQVMEDYLRQYDSKLRPATKYLYRGAIRRCFIDWAKMPISEIDEEMVAERHTELSTRNGPRGKGEAHANQAMRILRTIFNFAMVEYKDEKKRPIITNNPVMVLKQKRLWNKSKSRDDIISDEQLADWYSAVMKLESKEIRDCLLLCLFTGLRRGEALCLKWSSIRLTGKKPMLTIPAEDTKTGSEHQLPLSSFVLALLNERDKSRKVDNDYVFFGQKPGSHIVEPKRQVANVVEDSGIDFSMHTLRRTFATIAGRLDIAHYKHKMLMNHSMNQEVTGAHYVKMTVEDLREPMEKICQHICKHAEIELADAQQVQ
jgi:integrase